MNEKEKEPSAFYRIEKSALVTIIGIIFLFSFSVGIVLIAPRHIDPTWTQPTSVYQTQMYEVADPHFYISSGSGQDYYLQFVYHLQENYTLLAFHETSSLRIIAPPSLEKYITRLHDPKLKLSSRLLLLREPQDSSAEAGFNPLAAAERLRRSLQEEWEKERPLWKEKGETRPDVEILELYAPGGTEAFSYAQTEGILENWAESDYVLLDEETKQPYHREAGVIYVNNPKEYRISRFTAGDRQNWAYSPKGEAIRNLQELKAHPLGFKSRQELIYLGEHIYAIEGCWYCHTDQTRTLVQDVVLNGGAAYPAPPSSANEYVYQKITFPGTRRIGPDLSRTGVKRPGRDWHKGHFWSPKTASSGSIMPAFRHFFDNDPRGTSKSGAGVPNLQFEAIYQYLMTKGTRITPPTQAWWLGKDPINTKEIIEGRRRLP